MVPAIPDPDTAVTAQMIKAQNDVKAFIHSAEVYIRCEQLSRRRKIMADEIQEIADKFNASIRKYKARMAAS